MGVSFVVPGESTSHRPETAPTVRSVGPRASEWLPDLQKTLLPTAARTVRELAHAHDPRILQDERSRLFAREVLHQRYDVGTWSSTYPEAITRYALRYAGVDPETLDERERAQYDELRTELTTVGTGRDALNSGLDALDKTIVPLLQQATTTPRIVLVLDGPAWTSVGDERTAARALDTIALFGEVCEVHVVCSPRLRQHLDRHHPEWCDDYLDLTDSRDGWGQTLPEETSKRTRTEAWATINQFDPDGGRLAVLEALSADNPREVRDLKADPEIELAAGTIDRYVRELADEHGLVAIDTRPTYNRVALTERGAAATALLGPDGRPQHPTQTRLDSDLTATSQPSTSVVYGTARDTTTGVTNPDGMAATEWMSETGPAATEGYVQELGGPESRLSERAMHERLLAGRRVEGVTVVDEPIERFEDGRVSYISCFDEHAQAVVEWSGPLVTLVRITSALLSERLWETVLTPAALGDHLENVYEGTFEESETILRFGAQLGWLSEDEATYESLRERYESVRRRLLATLGSLDREHAPQEWRECCRDAHGLLAATTQLYRAIGVELTLHVRIPDTAQLRRNESRYREFLGFFEHTVPKNAAYGVHSAYRLLYETREHKLKHRLGVAFDDPAPTADLTAHWVVTGPTATDCRDDIEAAIAGNAAAVREAIQTGDERGIGFEVPVVEGNGYAAIRRIVERQCARKGYDSLAPGDYRRLTRIGMALLGSQPGRCSPYAVAEALLALPPARTGGRGLVATDIASGLATLSADRLVPSLSPTARTMLRTLLGATGPLGRTAVLERTAISGRSYDRHIGTLAGLGIVCPTTENGHRRWELTLGPWWSTATTTENPGTNGTPGAHASHQAVETRTNGPEWPPTHPETSAAPDSGSRAVRHQPESHWRTAIGDPHEHGRLADEPDRPSVEIGAAPASGRHEQTMLPSVTEIT